MIKHPNGRLVPPDDAPARADRREMSELLKRSGFKVAFRTLQSKWPAALIAGYVNRRAVLDTRAAFAYAQAKLDRMPPGPAARPDEPIPHLASDVPVKVARHPVPRPKPRRTRVRAAKAEARA